MYEMVCIQFSLLNKISTQNIVIKVKCNFLKKTICNNFVYFKTCC